MSRKLLPVLCRAASGCRVCRLSRCLKHVLDIDAVPAGRIVHEHVRHSADQPPILQNRTSAHTLHDAARLFKQFGIRHGDEHIAAICALTEVHLADANAVFFDPVALHVGEDCGLTRMHLLRRGNAAGFAGRCLRQMSKDTTGGITFMKLGGDSLKLGLKDGFSLSMGWKTVIGFLLYLISFLLWQRLIVKYDLSIMVPIVTGIVQVLTLVISKIIFKEEITTLGVVGAIIVIIGIVVMNFKIPTK